MRGFILASVAALIMSLPTLALAAPPAPLSTDAYGRLPNVELMQLSPSGARLAYVVTDGDKRTVLVKDLAGALQFTVPLADRKVRDMEWAGDDRLLITFGQTMQIGTTKYEVDETVSANFAAKKTSTIFATTPNVFHATYGFFGAVNQSGHWYGYFGGETLQKTLGFEPTFNADPTVDLYRVDLDTGEIQLSASAVQQQRFWALDADGKLVAHSEYNEKWGQWSLHNEVFGADPLLATKAPLHEIGLDGLGRTPGTVLINNNFVLEEWSVKDGAHAPLPTERLAESPIYDPTTHRLVGVVLTGDRPDQQFFAPTLAARQAAFKKALGGALWLSSWSADFQRLVLFSFGDGDAGTYWLVNGREVKPVAYSYPDIPDANVGTSQMIAYKAADGLEIHGVLTLPPGRDPKNLPLVVLPHGGPEGHDAVGFDWQAQAFASRGYAVFQPNFRGSDGYGLDFRNAGFGQWGRKMQTDISDGVAELSRRGVIDLKRACIVGDSYGGYAALAGVTVQQGLYRCAVSYAGISDLDVFLSWQTDYGESEMSASARYLRKFLGVEASGDAALNDLSPARLAGRADAPILLIHGADDTNVPIAQSREMERALRAAGKPVDFVLLPSEDHYLSKDATRKAMLSAAVAFVEKYNPAD